MDHPKKTAAEHEHPEKGQCEHEPVVPRFAAHVTIEGTSREYARVSDEGGRRAFFHFCPDCGATVFYTAEDVPGYVAVPVGAFADPSFPTPTVSVWEERRHAWVGLPDGIEHVR